MSKVIEVGSVADLESVVSQSGDVVVMFSQPRTCVPCRQFRPHYDAASEKSEATFIYADLDVVPEVMYDYSIMSVPTVRLYRDSQILTDLKERTAIKLLTEIQSA